MKTYLFALGLLLGSLSLSCTTKTDQVTVPDWEPPPFYADLRGITQSQTKLGLGTQSRTFPVWHLMGPWDDASRERFKLSMQVRFDNSNENGGPISDWDLSWESVANEPNMARVTVHVPLTQSGAYTVQVSAWCQRPEWMPFSTIGEIHVPAGDRPWQPMCHGNCAFVLAADSCPGVGDARVVELSASPPKVVAEFTLSEPFSGEHMADLQFSFEEQCSPDCGRSPSPSVPLAVQWRSPTVAVVEANGDVASKLLTATTESQVLAAIVMSSPVVGFGVPHELYPTSDGDTACRLAPDMGGAVTNYWAYPEMMPGGNCTVWSPTGLPDNPYIVPTEAMLEEGHPNPYLPPQDATP
jgi:hypothetical protein